MASTTGASIQTLTDGRLTLKQAHLEYLELPPDNLSIDLTFGPDKCILIHNPAKREQLVNEILGNVSIIPDEEESEVELRLDSVATNVPVDEQGRLRIPELFLKFGDMLPRSCRVCLLPRRKSGWLELRTESNFDAWVANPDDRWMRILGRVLREARGEQREQPAA
ncbi:MAG: hypothetical protein HPY69_17460 [Armatimonadetes bacterium]|nr:hypothetical protein [Armatimonadota bacterium]